jgi:hypothetical protein
MTDKDIWHSPEDKTRRLLLVDNCYDNAGLQGASINEKIKNQVK